MTDDLFERTNVAWLHRRAGFGLRPAEATDAYARGTAGELEHMITAATAQASLDPFAGLDPKVLDVLETDGKAVRDSFVVLMNAWLDHMISAPAPLIERMTWFWHGHLVAGVEKVHLPQLMADYVRALHTHALGNLRDLLKAITVDGAMLVYLDGTKNIGKVPNENFSRELMELFTLGLTRNGTANYTEADVAAGAKALSGWIAGRNIGGVRFVAARHDDSPQRYLGRTVHDVDSVIDAVLAHDACAPYIAGRLSLALLGRADAAVVDAAATSFRASGYEITTLVRALLEAGLSGSSSPVVQGPVPWLLALQRATGAAIAPGVRLVRLRSAGQLPLDPPNVSGWPSGSAWYSSAAVVERFNLAAQVASAVPKDSPVLVAAAKGDFGSLAGLLGRPQGFSDGLLATLSQRTNVTERLVLAFASPDLVEA